MMNSFLLIRVLIERDDITRIAILYTSKRTIFTFFYFFGSLIIFAMQGICNLYVSIRLIFIPDYKITLKITNYTYADFIFMTFLSHKCRFRVLFFNIF